VAGYAVSIACLIWVYRGFNWQEELPRFRSTDWRWVSVAIVGDILVYFCQGWRWAVLLGPVQRTPVWRAIQAIYIGLFANEVLPLRTGEVIRSYLVSRWGPIPFSVTISSAVIERLFDGVWLILSFYVAAQFVELPGWVVFGSQILAVLLLLLTLLLAWAVLRREDAEGMVLRSRWSDGLRHLVHGLHLMGRSRSFYVAFLISFLYLALQVLPIWALMIGYDLDLTMADAALVLVILRLGSVPPQAPGNVGSFQALTIAGLHLCGIDRASSTGFATLLFFVVTVPLWLAGFIALIATGMKLGDIHRQAHRRDQPTDPAATNADVH
jgi:glycosyltransferase 2 family protein